jgi:hypothetical protein
MMMFGRFHHKLADAETSSLAFSGAAAAAAGGGSTIGAAFTASAPQNGQTSRFWLMD